MKQLTTVVLMLLSAGCAHAQTEADAVDATTEEYYGDEETETTNAPIAATILTVPQMSVTRPAAETTTQTTKKPAQKVTPKKSVTKKTISKKKTPIKVRKLVLAPSKQQIVIKISARKGQPQNKQQTANKRTRVATNTSSTL